MKSLRILIVLVITCLACLILAPNAWAFCGFYVAKADTKLYNQASQVAIARNGNKTVLTMANDYQGEAKDFAIVVPVPVVLQKEQVRVGDPNVMAHLDAFSAPRLVEYFDPNPCEPAYDFQSPRAMPGRREGAGSRNQSLERRDLGVTIEAKFTVGEYDILILSAKESGGLETWLQQNGYKIPKGAKELLRPYIRQNMKFFVAKVNLGELAKSGYQNLRPLQMTYESPRFMLPIRLGMVNAQTEQDLIVYLLTPNGQAEVINYRTVKVPSDAEIPVFVKNEFSDFYKSMFQTSYVREGKNVAFLEYFWNMGNCDPCAAEPLTPDELTAAGVFWLDQLEQPGRPPSGRSPGGMRFRPPSANVYITRLHVRYQRSTFPEDLMFHETNNQQPFQGRYILRHPFTGTSTCPRAREYQRSLPRRFEQEAQTLARLTGWNIQDIREKLPKIRVSLFRW